MSKGREIRCYDYVNHPYQQVHDVLSKDALEVFQAATKAAVSRAEAVVSELRIDIGGIQVGKDVVISVTNLEQQPGAVKSSPATRLQLEWEAAKTPRLFPIMRGELSVYPLTATETQLDFSGLYEPPLGAVGRIIDAAIGHRIAEASVHRFMTDVGSYLRTALTKP